WSGLCNVIHAFSELVFVSAPLDPDEILINEELRPIRMEQRSFSMWEMANLWIGLVVGVPLYYMEISLVEMGMAWWQGIAVIMEGNLLLLFPLVLTGNTGTKFQFHAFHEGLSLGWEVHRKASSSQYFSISHSQY
ncbi:hypothetical protein KI387_017735, partial [Taxus chinensis]